MTDCEKKDRGSGEWICDRCGSSWNDYWAGVGWLPLSCPGRKQNYNPLPGFADALAAQERE